MTDTTLPVSKLPPPDRYNAGNTAIFKLAPDVFDFEGRKIVNERNGYVCAIPIYRLDDFIFDISTIRYYHDHPEPDFTALKMVTEIAAHVTVRALNIADDTDELLDWVIGNNHEFHGVPRSPESAPVDTQDRRSEWLFDIPVNTSK